MLEQAYTPGEVGFDVPEEVEGQLACLLLPRDMLAVLGLPQLVGEGHCQVVLADVLLHLPHHNMSFHFKNSLTVMKYQACRISHDS